MNRRFSPHPYLCSELVLVTTEHAGRDSQAIFGNLEEIGERSALLLTQVPFRCGTEINININPHVLNGIVEGCNFEEPLGCYIEVRLKPESRWSERWFKPKHLLALRFREVEGNASKVLPLENPSVTEYFVRADCAPRVQVRAHTESQLGPERYGTAASNPQVPI
jgi:hypothetical protein